MLFRSALVADIFGERQHGQGRTLSKAVEQDLVWVATNMGFGAIVGRASCSVFVLFLCYQFSHIIVPHATIMAAASRKEMPPIRRLRSTLTVAMEVQSVIRPVNTVLLLSCAVPKPLGLRLAIFRTYFTSKRASKEGSHTA